MDNILSIGEMQVPITRIADLRELPGMEWITALRAPAVAALARDGGPLHMPALLGWANSRNLVLGALDARSTSVEEAFHADKPLAAAALKRTTATSAGQAARPQCPRTWPSSSSRSWPP
jgi:hypothetical protein